MFDLYDTDKSGSITGIELEMLVRDLFGGALNNQAKSIIKEIPKGQVLFADFQHFVKIHHALMLPAIHFQSDLRRMIVNDNFWMKKTELRQNIPRDQVAASLKWAKDRLLVQGSSRNLNPKVKKKAESHRFSPASPQQGRRRHSLGSVGHGAQKRHSIGSSNHPHVTGFEDVREKERQNRERDKENKEKMMEMMEKEKGVHKVMNKDKKEKDFIKIIKTTPNVTPRTMKRNSISG